MKAAQSDRFELSRQTGLRRKPKGKKNTNLTNYKEITWVRVPHIIKISKKGTMFENIQMRAKIMKKK